jgi:hypothetical protein
MKSSQHVHKDIDDVHAGHHASAPALLPWTTATMIPLEEHRIMFLICELLTMLRFLELYKVMNVAKRYMLCTGRINLRRPSEHRIKTIRSPELGAKHAAHRIQLFSVTLWHAAHGV